MSILTTIYDDLEAMSVSYVDKDGATVTATCLNIDEKADSIQTAHLPCRILLNNQQESGSILRGAGIDATWQITDLFLIETATRDLGGHILYPVLARYKVAYLSALTVLWNMVHGFSTEALSMSWTCKTGRFEYPAGSGTWFYGVQFGITINEIF